MDDQLHPHFSVLNAMTIIFEVKYLNINEIEILLINLCPLHIIPEN